MQVGGGELRGARRCRASDGRSLQTRCSLTRSMRRSRSTASTPPRSCSRSSPVSRPATFRHTSDLRAQLARGRALIAAREGEHGCVESDLTSAIDGFRSLGYPYWLSRAQTDLAAWLAASGRGGELAALIAAAIATVEQLRAAPALARAHEVAVAWADPISP